MKISRFLAIAVMLAGLFLMLQGPGKAWAQDQDQDVNSDQDPPSRVARLNYSTGAVSFQPGGQGDWVDVDSNRPLTSGDNLWADKGGRAELHVGSTAIRMNSETSLTFLDLDDHSTQLRLSLGSVLLRVRHLDDGDNFEVDTPNLAFAIQAAGEYRVEVNADGNQTITTVWHGRGEATGGGYSYDVVAGQQARFDGTDQLDHEIAQIGSSDDFANWSFDRDKREDGAESANYISPEVTGYEDLDDHGRWRYVAGYGNVWTPTGVASDWAPYRYGHWVWVEPWGWTWVEDEPWGFAPFHYGRWAYAENSWCWVPGPVTVRPVYSPALVAFVGGSGFHVAIGVGGGPVGWFPLGPGEVYVPPYRVSRRYVNNVNVTNTRVNITQVTNVYNVYNSNTTSVTRITYVNQRPQATTVVSRDTFINARPVNRNVVRVDDREISQAQVAHRVDVQPQRASIEGAGRPVQMRPPARIVERQVVATRAPTPSRPTFEQRQAPANVRTEAPGRPAPAREANEPQRPQSPVQANQNRGNDDRPQQQAEQPQRQVNSRPAEMRPVPRPPKSERVQVNGPSGQPPQAQNETRPEQNIARPDQNQRPDEGRAERDRQPQNQADQNRQERQDRPEPNQNRPQEQREVAHPPQQNERPLVRQAPPVQERPQQQQNEEQKFRQWQDQRQRTAQPQPRPQQEQPHPQVAGPPEQHAPAPTPAQHPQRNDDKPHGRNR
jgi:hypothetical protein